jgi:dihydroorotate dehydrogenase electron transfer subunit
MSFSHSDGITVKAVGPVSTALSRLSEGDRLSIDGPLGRGFTIDGTSVVLIGGGFGVAPLRFLAECCHARGMTVTTLLGFRSGKDVFFEQELAKHGDVYVATEDGSCGEQGMITCLFEAAGTEFDRCYCCGPERMMAAVVDRFKGTMPIQVSLERYMKCGRGLCGSCEMDGLLVCKDGPVFDAEELGPSFGAAKRDKTGKRIPL